MASEYLRCKAREEKLLNWLYYHRLHLIAAAVLLWIGGSILWNGLGIGQIRPDYIFAYIGQDELPQETAAQLESALAALGEDVNGDGTVAVELRQYALNRSGEAETALYYNYAANTQLMADLTAGDSYFFLVQDPQAVQRAWQIFAMPDGSPPEDSDWEAMDKVYGWPDCPVLAGLPLEQEALTPLYFGRRCFYEERQASGQAANDAFWQVLTKGAQR